MAVEKLYRQSLFGNQYLNMRPGEKKTRKEENKKKRKKRPLEEMEEEYSNSPATTWSFAPLKNANRTEAVLSCQCVDGDGARRPCANDGDALGWFDGWHGFCAPLWLLSGIFRYV